MAENILNRFENIYDEEPELDLTKKVKVVFDANGVEMTYPHLNVHLDK